MEIGEVPITESIPEQAGKKRYEVEGTSISVAWKSFQPTETSRQQEGHKQSKAVVFLPAWYITEQAKSSEILAQSFADYSHNTEFVVDARAERVVDDSLAKEAEAVRQFIQERGLRKVILVGNSRGGAQAIHLTALLQEINPNINIEGLILLDSVSLYNQTGVEFGINLVRDMLNTQMGLLHPSRFVGSEKVVSQNRKYSADGIVEILREVMRSNISYPSRIIKEIKSMVKANPHLGHIKAPIVIIQGARDLISDPAKIIPNQNPETKQEPPYIKDIRKREEFLKQNVFVNSPYIRMLVPEKMGYHNVVYSRSRSVAEVSLNQLGRWHRQQGHSQIASGNLIQ